MVKTMIWKVVTSVCDNIVRRIIGRMNAADCVDILHNGLIPTFWFVSHE